MLVDDEDIQDKDSTQGVAKLFDYRSSFVNQQECSWMKNVILGEEFDTKYIIKENIGKN